MMFGTMDLNKDCMLDQSDTDLLKDSYGPLFHLTEREVGLKIFKVMHDCQFSTRKFSFT